MLPWGRSCRQAEWPLFRKCGRPERLQAADTISFRPVLLMYTILIIAKERPSKPEPVPD
jgi:hypothetical protein